MAVIETLGQIFGMFDKVDDIILEPIKLLCDVLRQPLKQIDYYNDKNRTEQEQTLKIEYEHFQADLEQTIKDREMNRTLEQKRLEIEINEMILNNDILRREKMIKLEAHYREQMAKVATDIEKIMLSITESSRDKIFTLYDKHKTNYINIQQKYTDTVFSNVERMQKLFPGEASQKPIMDYMMKYIEQISEESTNFLSVLTTDMKNVLDIIDDSSKITMGIAGKYLTPTVPNSYAITENITKSIETK